jgi:mRNA interferase MazF
MGSRSGPESLCQALSKATSSASPCPYTDRSTRRHQPALVVSKGGIGEGNGTSAENRAWPGDVSLGDLYAEAGLPAPSVVRPCKLATIEVRHAERLGHIEPALLRAVAKAIRGYLGF